MRRIAIILTLALCLVVTDRAHGQRALKGMRGIEVRGGMVDGFYASAARDHTGYYFGLAMATYAKNANKWVWGAEVLNRNYPYKETRIPATQFTAEGGYYYNFLADYSKTALFNIGGSVLSGYEMVNKGERTLSDGSTLMNRGRFLYGGAITLEVDVYLTNSLALMLSARERILWGTTTGHFHTQFGVGLRFMIN